MVNVRRIQLDVDKAIQRPNLLDLAAAIENVSGVQAANVTVTEIDLETMGTEVTVVGDAIDVAALTAAIEKTGCAVHSIDEVVVGEPVVVMGPMS